MKRIEQFEKQLISTPIVPLSSDYGNNQFFMKRDDMLPFCFGGNKVRKATEFYKDIIQRAPDVIMTYGSSSSNHCRIIANMAAAMEIPCHIISPEENRKESFNTDFIAHFGATIETCPIDRVSQTIEERKEWYLNKGMKPYFIQGGGHGNPGTEAYVKAYEEICNYESTNHTFFDYIFHASGTGTTQAGLVCGQFMKKQIERNIIGISIARNCERGRAVIQDSIKDYLGNSFDESYRDEKLVFVDDYRCGGYGLYDTNIEDTIKKVMKQEGIPMDTTYVGKAFYGMQCYIREKAIENKKILFIHTGGTPLYFDWLTGR